MAIEKDLGRIATALEQLVKTLQQDVNPVVTTAPAPAPAAAPAAAPAQPTLVETPAPAPAAPAPAPAPAPAAPAPAAALSPEEMNTLLVSEFKRIGDRAPIDAAMSELGVISVTDLPADKQQTLIAAVAAIPSAA